MTRLSKLIFTIITFLMLTAGTSFASFATTANVTSAKIDPNDPSKINVTATVSDFDPSNPPAVYLFSMKPYQSDVSGRADYLSAQQASSSMTFTFDMQDGPASNRLYDAFALAVDGGSGSYQLISNRCYITNPEVIAPDQSAPAIYGKKGLMIDPNLIDDALKLNLKQASISITTAQLLGSGIPYSFEGQNYSFSAKNVSELDNQISRLSNAGVAVTAILLNGFNGAQPDLYIPGTSVQTSDQALYYGFNVMTERGFNLVKAIASFLANRYSGYNGHGKITNWVIGNEINNQYWNYIGNYDVGQYTLIYQRAFRTFYTAIKSVSAGDSVMFSLDLYWNMLPETGVVGKYTGKSVLEAFSILDQMEGKTDWGLALHPYPYPIWNPIFWDDYETGKVNNTDASPVVSMANISVITNYMHRADLLTRAGTVRDIYLTEQGFNSNSRGQDATLDQAAAFAYAYYMVNCNPDIKGFLLSRQLDHTEETKTGLAYGLQSVDPANTNHLIERPIKDVFRNIDDPNLSMASTAFALPIIGISSWDQVIPNFHY